MSFFCSDDSDQWRIREMDMENKGEKKIGGFRKGFLAGFLAAAILLAVCLN